MSLISASYIVLGIKQKTENLSLNSSSKPPLIIDSHCHLDFSAFSKDYQAVLTQCKLLGVSDIVIPGVTFKTLSQLIHFCSKNSGDVKLHYALGLHPVFLNEHQNSDLDQLADLIKSHKPIAVGEIGLDFFLAELDKHQQTELFIKQLSLAQSQQLPVILHVRKAHDEVIHSLKQLDFKHGGIVHAFNGSLQQAHKYIDMGFKLGFGGMLTYQRSTKLHNLAKQLPLSAIVLETDSPDMTVEAHRGERNSPEYLPMVLNALSKLREESIAVISEVTSQNAIDALNLESINDGQ